MVEVTTRKKNITSKIIRKIINKLRRRKVIYISQFFRVFKTFFLKIGLF